LVPAECQLGSGGVRSGYCDVAGGAFPDAGQRQPSPRSRAGCAGWLPREVLLCQPMRTTWPPVGHSCGPRPVAGAMLQLET
jgi:hypothetical protein